MFEPPNINSPGNLNFDGVSVEEVLLDSDANVFHESLQAGYRPNLIRFISAVVLIGLLVIVIQLFNLQIRGGEGYLLAAEGNRIRTIQNFAPRGKISDRYGEVIVRNTPRFELVAIPTYFPKPGSERAALVMELSLITSLPAEEIEAKLAEAGEVLPVTLKQSLTQEEALKLEDLVSKTAGLQIQSAPIREYLSGPVFANIIGYVGKLNREEWEKNRSNGYFFNDVIGKSGLELVYEDVLRGEHGGLEMEVDATGSAIKKLRDREPEPGRDLELTIDAGLQNVIFNSLQRIMASRPSATGGAAVAMDPRTGEILSLVSLPSFDNNLFAQGISTPEYNRLINNKNKPLLNRPIAGAYPPGSTIKPLIAAAALEEGVITDKTRIKDEGVIRVGSFTFYGWDREGLGIMDVVSALAKSSDPFFYVIGGGHEDYKIEGLGVSRIVSYLRKFKLGEKFGIRLPGEEAGFVPSPEWKKERFAGTDEENWYLGNTYHLSIGQGYLLTTPLQVAEFTAAIANGGKIFKPLLVKDEKPEVLAESGLSRETLDIVRKGMRENVISGSGVRLSSLPVEVAGKTGTAQFDGANLDRTHAWYTGYAPYNNPEIVITIFLEAGGEGHSSAVPVVEDALEWWTENRK